MRHLKPKRKVRNKILSVILDIALHSSGEDKKRAEPWPEVRSGAIRPMNRKRSWIVENLTRPRRRGRSCASATKKAERCVYHLVSGI